MYLGSWKIDDNLTFTVVTTRFDTGAATDADAVPAYRVYEDETATPIVTGNMALLDSTNTAGFYSEQIALSAANGFEKGKSYNIYIAATVNSVAGATTRNFQIEAEVDANIVSDKTGYGLADSAITSAKFAAGAIDAAAIANGAIDAATFAADVDAEFLSYIVDDATKIDASALNTASVTTIPAILLDTAEIGAAGAGLTEAGGTGDHLTAVPWNAGWDAEVQSEVTDALNAALTEAYAADGSTFSVAQALYMIWAFLAEKSISGTTMTAAKLDGTTAAMTFTLDDDTAPASITRAT